nr:hypothetical protein [uncultured Ralstonia sp.]
MAKRKVTAPQDGKRRERINNQGNVACAMTDIDSNVPAAQSRDFTVMCPFGLPLRW